VDAENVYTVGPFGHMYCVSLKTHQPVWSKNILEIYGGKVPRWGITQCPLLHKDAVIVVPNGREAGAVALKKETGEEVWRSEALKGGLMGSYGSPMLTTVDGVDQVLVVTSGGTMGLDAETGKTLWRTRDWQCFLPIVSAMPVGDGRIFVTGGYKAGSAMFKVEKVGDAFSCKTLFKTRDCNCEIHQPLLYGGHLYMNGNDGGHRDGLICMDLEGRVKWKTGQSPGFDWGGLLLADDRIYVIDGTRGDLCMVSPDPSGYREVARMPLFQGKEIWGTIALSDGKLLCRNRIQLKCVDVRGN
jgi:outer membrane protein assembly factor BamB